jgi:DNA-binding response OmpR family regulator
MNQKVPTILVVEDDADIQVMLEEAFIEAGFYPAIVPTAEEALTLLQGAKDNYHALVSDIGLRGSMTGWEFAQRAREINPEFPVVYISGASGAEWASKGVPNSIMLQKPFAPAQLMTAVSQLLNAIPPTAPA